jgi:hypothetical protein
VKKFAIAALAAAGIALGVGACAPPTTSTYAPPAPKPVTVEYQVDGSATSASLTYQNPTGVAQTDASLPTSLPYPQGQFHAGDFVYVSAQNSGASGTTTCRILVDGVVISQNTASGAYTIATCSGSA